MTIADTLPFALLAFTSFLSIINPISAASVFVAMTGSYDAPSRRRTASRAVRTAAVVLCVFALFGPLVLRLFGITIPAFKIAGALLFVGVGFDMLRAKHSRVRATEEEQQEGAQKEDIGVIPLGIPQIAGPGAITTVITITAQAEGMFGGLGIALALGGALAITWLVLLFAPALMTRLGQTGANVISRVMGLLVVVIGVQFAIDGVSAVLRGLMES